MPEEGSFIKFHDGQYQFKVAFIMYADVESILETIESPKPNPEELYTKVINQHISSGFCVNSEFAYGKLKIHWNSTEVRIVYHIKKEDFYADIASDVALRFDTSGYDKADVRPLPIGKNKKVIRVMKDELGGKIMTEFVALRPKSYAYRKLDNKEDKKCKGIKKCIVKKTISFDDYKNCLLDAKSKGIYRSQLMFRNNKHEIHTVEVNKVALVVYNMGVPAHFSILWLCWPSRMHIYGSVGPLQ